VTPLDSTIIRAMPNITCMLQILLVRALCICVWLCLDAIPVVATKQQQANNNQKEGGDFVLKHKTHYNARYYATLVNECDVPSEARSDEAFC
jgi:hypothetical protein